MRECDFFNKYNLIATTIYRYTVISPIRKCRFCEQDERDTSFKKKAHILSELLGENNIICYDECDKCNELFSKYESHLSKYFLPDLTMVGVKGKNSVPTFHSRTDNGNEDTRTVVKYVSDTQPREIIVSKQNDVSIDDDRKSAKIIFRRPKHKPINVYKSLVKFGLSILPVRKIQENRAAFNWLINDKRNVIIFPSMIIWTIGSRKFNSPSAYLYEAKEFIVDGMFFSPNHILIVCFGNLIVQVMLPLSRTSDMIDIANLKAKVSIYPIAHLNPIFEDSTANRMIDLSGNESIISDYSLSLTYDSSE